MFCPACAGRATAPRAAAGATTAGAGAARRPAAHEVEQLLGDETSPTSARRTREDGVAHVSGETRKRVPLGQPALNRHVLTARIALIGEEQQAGVATSRRPSHRTPQRRGGQAAARRCRADASCRSTQENRRGDTSSGDPVGDAEAPARRGSLRGRGSRPHVDRSAKGTKAEGGSGSHAGRGAAWAWVRRSGGPQRREPTGTT